MAVIQLSDRRAYFRNIFVTVAIYSFLLVLKLVEQNEMDAMLSKLPAIWNLLLCHISEVSGLHMVDGVTLRRQFFPGLHQIAGARMGHQTICLRGQKQPSVAFTSF